MRRTRSVVKSMSVPAVSAEGAELASGDEKELPVDFFRISALTCCDSCYTPLTANSPAATACSFNRLNQREFVRFDETPKFFLCANSQRGVLPPTKQELLQQIKRTSYICSMWCNAHMRRPTEKSPENCGWALIDDKYHYY
ncbi:hypothetical protein EVAR_91699_1 [Eumeta japonica]|uniref:Uncharacterized protein n=1 Tax=Eumeta variegata TaxID=151549 RepID=A0A4C1ZIC0_EUMVA|nr:hypothetical protein EVAR_91699_1 [Eumeta japonica]